MGYRGIHIPPAAAGVFEMPFSAQETWYWHGDISADNVVMSGVKCSGTEMSLAHCRHDGAYVSCPRGGGRFGAGVSCSESE